MSSGNFDVYNRDARHEIDTCKVNTQFNDMIALTSGNNPVPWT